MKNNKKYLNLTLPIALCASFCTFAMEKERPSASGEWSYEWVEEQPIGEENTSSEAGIKDPIQILHINKKIKQLLAEQIKTLQKIDNKIITALKDQDISNEKRKKLIELLNFTNETIIMANDMVLDLIPVDMQSINKRVNLIIQRWNQK
jgi:hypothetical protein